MTHRYTIKNKKRFAIFTFTLIFIVFVLIFVITVYAFDKETSAAEKNEVYIVSPGDTIWEIASEHKVNTDIVTYIYKLKKINDLQSSDISIGTKLILP